MRNLIIYPKISGNTYDICRYIKKEANTLMERVMPDATINLYDVDNIIICSGVYSGHVHKNILRWLESQESLKDMKFHMLLTWFGRGKSNYAAYKEVKEMVLSKDGEMMEDIFCCYGKGFGVVRQSHPDKDDYDNALNWVRKIS